MPPKGRKNEKDNWLPPRVYRGRTNYEWHPKTGGSIKIIRLPADGIETPAVKAQVWKIYNEKANEDDAPYLVKDLILDFHSSPQFTSISARTQKDYEGYSQRVNRVFGKMLPSEVKIFHIRGFMDALVKKIQTESSGKHTGFVTANRHHSYISTLFAWGLERNKCTINPATGIRKFQEKPRDRLAGENEYWLVYNAALESSYPWIAPLMEIAYLCRMRPSEARTLSEKNISERGIFVERGKGSKNEITKWSPRLHAAVNLARSHFPNAPVNIEHPLFHDKNGVMRTDSARKTAWKRIISKALENGLKERFTFHDLKARGATNHPDKESGHKTKKMEAVYDRAPNEVDATE